LNHQHNAALWAAVETSPSTSEAAHPLVSADDPGQAGAPTVALGHVGPDDSSPAVAPAIGLGDAVAAGPAVPDPPADGALSASSQAATRKEGRALTKTEPAAMSTPHALLDEALSADTPADAHGLLGKTGRLVIDHQNNVYIVRRGAGNPRPMRLGSSEFRGLIAKALRASGQRVSKNTIDDLVEELKAEAEVSGLRADVWRRVAELDDGTVVIALHDDANTHVRITPGKVELVTQGSPVLFHRGPLSVPMVVPAAVGDFKLLRKYLNLDWTAFPLYVAWVTYTIAHGKVQGNVFPILVFIGGQGAGKSGACKITIALIDRNVVGVERMPANAKDLAIAAQNHVVAYDNVRHIAHVMSDALCTLATGGALTGRALYTNDQQHLIRLHGAVILNGIYSFIEQPDLAQRSVPMRLDPIAEDRRKSEADMLKEFEGDLPTIMRGLYDLIAAIKLHLPAAEVTHPQRMLDFVRWLAAMEMVQKAPAGTFQQLYADVLNEGQLDSLRDNVLGTAVLDFAEALGDEEWSGTPAELLAKLNTMQCLEVRRPPRAWPDNEIAMSRRLIPLQAALLAQGIEVQFKRGKHRTITIRRVGGAA